MSDSKSKIDPLDMAYIAGAQDERAKIMRRKYGDTEMSETKDDGGSAFPIGDGKDICWDKNSEKYHLKFPGMSLRDHFAGQAMNGMLAAISDYLFTTRDSLEDIDNSIRMAAMCAYKLADAMLQERKR